VRRIIVCIVSAVFLAACGDDPQPAATNVDIEITVFAAASLTDVFEEIGDAYERDNPGTSVRFNFLSSSDLATQIEQGAPAEVFASADEANMQRLVDQDLTGSEPEVFVRNRLAIVVPADNPAGVQDLDDLEDDELVVALCVEECPAGKYAREVFGNAGVEVEPDSLEPDVKAVITRVELGEADAGIVYVTDIIAAGDDVAGIDIPDDDNVTANYVIAVLRDAEGSARGFVDFVQSERAQDILASHGFLPK
jgi:molybdate transport system substrate-binding protein